MNKTLNKTGTSTGCNSSLKTTKEKVYDLYMKIYKTEDEPNGFDLARLVNLIMQASRCCPDTEEQVGKDVLDLFKKCSKFKRGGVDVNITKLRSLLEN